MGKKNNIKSKKGFTIIEVVLVLAIAGLIFLMVFIALPALQRSQRNTQRRDDYSMLVTAVNNYMASNNGKLGNLISKKNPNVLVASRWVNNSGLDSNGNPYAVYATDYTKWSNSGQDPKPTAKATKAIEYCDGADGAANKKDCEAAKGKWVQNYTGDASEVYIIVKANCRGVDNDSGDPKPSSDGAARAFAVYGYLEGGSVFCQDSGSN